MLKVFAVKTYFAFAFQQTNVNILNCLLKIQFCTHAYLTDCLPHFLQLTSVDSLMLSSFTHHRMVISNLNRLFCVYHREKAKIMEGLWTTITSNTASSPISTNATGSTAASSARRLRLDARRHYSWRCLLRRSTFSC